jgi:hypothetical protein
MNSPFPFDSSSLVFIFLVFIGSMMLMALTLLVWVILRIRRPNLPPGADFLLALRVTPLMVVIALDELDLGMDIFSAPIACALLSYLGLAPLRRCRSERPHPDLKLYSLDDACMVVRPLRGRPDNHFWSDLAQNPKMTRRLTVIEMD